MKTWKNLTVGAFVGVLTIFGIAVLGTACASKPAPKTAEEFRVRGNTYFDQNDANRAMADYNKAINLNPNFALAYYSRGRLYFAQSNYDRAIADFTKAIQIDPNIAFPYRNRGDVYAAQKDYDRAIADYETALRINPNYAEAKEGLENARVAVARAEQAQRNAERQTQQEQARQAEQTRLANLYRQAGNNFGNLPNTSRRWTHSADRRIYTMYNFGNGNYICESNFNLFGMASTETGTFRVNGDTLIFLSSEGEYSSATIIGTTFTVVGDIFTGGADMVFR